MHDGGRLPVFAGWGSSESPAHRAIRALSPGDPLSLLHEDGQWKVLDQDECRVGRMAQSWTLPANMRVERATVHGTFTRWATDDVYEHRRKRLRSGAWEVVVAELTLSRA